MDHLVKGLKRSLKLIQDNKGLLDDLGTAAVLATQLSTGHPIVNATATISILSKLANRVYPKPTPFKAWARLPCQALSSNFEDLICTYAKEHTHETIELSAERVNIWYENNKPIMAIREWDSSTWGIKLATGQEQFLQKIMSSIWDLGTCLEINKQSGTKRNLTFIPLPPPTPYVGGIDIETYVKRARAQTGGRTIMLKGPTGTGKSSLARQIASRLGTSNRTLKIPGRLLKNWRGSELLELLKLLQPSMLLLDDVDPKNNTETLLDILETVRQEGMITIITMMEAGAGETTKPKQGDWHYPGMRPGRIDEIIHIPIPSASHREVILRFYANRSGLKIKKKIFAKIIKATNGLTGAYLAAIIDRICTHGVENWKHETELILRTAPKKKSDDE